MGAGSSSLASDARKQLETATQEEIAAAAAELDPQDKEKFLAAILEAEKLAAQPVEKAPEKAERKWWLPEPGHIYTSVTSPKATNPTTPTSPGGTQKGRASLMKAFRTGELDQVVDKMEEANSLLESEANTAVAVAA